MRVASLTRDGARDRDVTFFEDVAGRDNSELLRLMQQQTDLVTIAEAERLVASDQHDEARRLVEGVLNDPRSTVETWSPGWTPSEYW